MNMASDSQQIIFCSSHPTRQRTSHTPHSSMSSISDQIEQECERRKRSVSGISTSPDSWETSLVPSPRTSRKSCLTFPNLRSGVSSLSPISESVDPAEVWEDDRYSCQLAQNRDNARLENEYHIYELEFHLCHIFPRPKHPLSRIRPPPKIEEYIFVGASQSLLHLVPTQENRTSPSVHSHPLVTARSAARAQRSRRRARDTAHPSLGFDPAKSGRHPTLALSLSPAWLDRQSSIGHV